MRKIFLFIFIVAILTMAIPAMAVSPAGKRYINQIVGGGSSSFRRAAQSMYRTEFTERAALDVLAEKLLQNYNKTKRMGVDSIAWGCKALGQSRDIRYKNVLAAIAQKAENRKVKKYAKQSLKKMPKGKAKKPYKKGSINLKAMRKKMSKGQSAVKSSKSKSKKNRRSLSVVSKGMSREEVSDLLGEPTSTSTRVTGKAFNPFYYGSDNARLTYYYKGKGRVLFSQRSSYSNVWRVMEVELDSSEPGYP